MAYELGKIRTDRGEFIDKGNYAVDPCHPDFEGGADPEGLRDSRGAFAAADAHAVANGLGLIIRPGTYSISSNLTLTSQVDLSMGVSFTGAGTLTYTGRSVSGVSRDWGGVHYDVCSDLNPAGAAVGDGTTDDTASIQAAIDAAADLGSGGRVFLPPGKRFRCASPLNADNTYGVTLYGSEGPYGSSNDSTVASIVFDQDGTDDLISARSSISFALEGLRIIVTNSAFTGRVVNLDGDLGYDTTYALISRCQIGGTSTAPNAAWGVTLNKAIICTIEKTLFMYMDYAVSGAPAGGGYSNVILIDECTFLRLGTNALHQGTQSWIITRNTFEQSITGKPLGYTEDTQSFGPIVLRDNWFGDNSVAGTPYIRFRGLRLLVEGNHFAGADAADGAIEIGHDSGAIYSAAIIGNTFGVSDVILVTGGATVRNLTLIGNTLPPTVTDSGAKVSRLVALGQTGTNAIDLPITLGPYGTIGTVATTTIPASVTTFFWGLLRGVTGYAIDTLAYVSRLSGGQFPHVFFGSDGSGNAEEWGRFDSTGVVTPMKVLATEGIGVGNSASASSLGTVTKKVQIFDEEGASLGYVPIYDAIT